MVVIVYQGTPSYVKTIDIKNQEGDIMKKLTFSHFWIPSQEADGMVSSKFKLGREYQQWQEMVLPILLWRKLGAIIIICFILYISEVSWLSIE